MGSSTRHEQALVVALATSLGHFGLDLLSNPQQLVGSLMDQLPESPELPTFRAACEEGMLGPFADVLQSGKKPRTADILAATKQSEALLIATGDVTNAEASRLCGIVARGVAAYLQLDLDAPEAATQPEPEPEPEPEPTPKRERKPLPRPSRKTLGTVAAAIAALAIVVVLALRTTVHFEGNGATSGTMQDMRVWKNSEFELPSCGFTRSGYGFLGWKGPGGRKRAGAPVEVSEPTTFRAEWGAEVSFNGNGATSGSVDDCYAESDGSVTLPHNGFKRTGYRFVGWSRKPNGKRIKVGTTVTVKDPTTFYVVWRPRARFVGNGADYGSTKSVRANARGQVTLPECGFRRSGWEFAGWSSSKRGSTVSPGTTITIDGPVTYYARWRAVVSFDGNGADSGSVDDKLADLDGRVSLPSGIDLDRSDYRFLGWATSRSGTPKGAYETVRVSGPTTFYAIWGAEVSFDANGGSGYTSSEYADADGRVTLPSCNYTYTDHVFDGWATSSTGSGLYDEGESVSVSSPKTYYATWKLDPNINDKLSVEQVTQIDGVGCCFIFLFVKNNSNTTLDVTGTIDFKSASGSFIKTTTNTAYSVAPGQRTLVYNSCDGAAGGAGATTYRVTAEEPDDSQGSIYPNVRVEQELNVSTGKLVVRLHNYSGKRVWLVNAKCYASDSNGAWAIASEGIEEYLDPGEYVDVAIDDDSGWLPWNQLAREYYVNGCTME